VAVYRASSSLMPSQGAPARGSGLWCWPSSRMVLHAPSFSHGLTHSRTHAFTKPYDTNFPTHNYTMDVAEYPSTMVTTYSALPALDVEPVSVIQPYNTVLGLASLLASADLSVLVSHGQGVGQGVGVGMNRSHSGSHDRRHYSTPPPTSFAAGLRSSRLATATASVTATTAATAALSLASTFTAENRAAASVICDVTSTMRFNDGNSR